MSIIENKYNIYPYRSEFNHVLQYKVSTLFEVNRIISTIAKSSDYRILDVNICNEITSLYQTDDIPTSTDYILILSLSSYNSAPIDPIELEKGLKI